MSNQKSLEERVAELEQKAHIQAATISVHRMIQERVAKILEEHEDVILKCAESCGANADGSVRIGEHLAKLEEAVIQMQRAVKQIQFEVFPSAKEQYAEMEASEPSSDPEQSGGESSGGLGGMWN